MWVGSSLELGISTWLQFWADFGTMDFSVQVKWRLNTVLLWSVERLLFHPRKKCWWMTSTRCSWQTLHEENYYCTGQEELIMQKPVGLKKEYSVLLEVLLTPEISFPNHTVFWQCPPFIWKWQAWPFSREFIRCLLVHETGNSADI